MDKLCAVCGDPIGHARTYCSPACRSRGRSLRDRSWRPALAKRCEWCDRGYVTSRRSGRYCSNSCARYGTGRAALACDLNWRECAVCGRWRCHGATCPDAAHHQVRVVHRGARDCESCGTTFTPKRPAGHLARFCSVACREREARSRYRARKRGPDRWRVDRRLGRVRRQAVFERDGWRCQLCGTKVDPARKVPDPLAATLDHVVPLSKGGEHAEANLQLAHLGCNSRKRDGVAGPGEQLRLVG